MKEPTDQDPQNRHSTTRILYKLQLRAKPGSPQTRVAVGQVWQELACDWQDAPIHEEPGAVFRFSEWNDTAAELYDGLFPYALAMKGAWGFLASRMGRHIEARLVPFMVKTEYATFAQEPMEPINPNAQ